MLGRDRGAVSLVNMTSVLSPSFKSLKPCIRRPKASSICVMLPWWALYVGSAEG